MKGFDPKVEEEYLIDRRRIEDDRDRKLEQLCRKRGLRRWSSGRFPSSYVCTP